MAGEDGGDATASTASTVAPKLNVSMAAFEVMDEIGEGSFSEVLLVRRRADGADKTPVALKVMRKRHILKENKGACVRDERKALDLLRDASRVVRLLFTFQDDECLYLGLERCAGGELFDRIQAAKRRREEKTKTKGGGLSLAATRRVASDLLDAVEACHARGVVHRDLKPENVLFDSKGRETVRLRVVSSAEREGDEGYVCETSSAAQRSWRSWGRAITCLPRFWESPEGTKRARRGRRTSREKRPLLSLWTGGRTGACCSSVWRGRPRSAGRTSSRRT